MADKHNNRKWHFILKGVTTSERYCSPQQRRDQTRVPVRDRILHGKALLGQIEALKPEMIKAREVQEEAGLEGGFGLQVEFESFPDIEMAFESLARERSGIELLNVRHDELRTYATVFVPDGKLEHFEGLIRDYLAERRDRIGRARDHRLLVDAIKEIRAATFRALWTDDPAVFPVSDQESFWWEVWLPIRDDRAGTVTTFCRLAEAQELRVATGELRFPERTVMNALTVGAYTDLVHISEHGAGGYQPIAQAGGLSPFSTTSATWKPQWPLKPDVVFEGGNAAKDAYGAVWMPSLSLLTTNHKPTLRLFATLNATSAATALAAHMAAQVMAIYPNLWPETVRALIVHSAEWTNRMKQMYFPPQGPILKSNYECLVRHCGFGVPDINRALWSISNSLTMVVETELHPFIREGSNEPTLRDMNLHRLPWPLVELEGLGDTDVEMRVTLSYFIEPNPSERGFRTRYRYESHGLRFDVKRPLESEDDFRSRINAAARDEEAGTHGGGDDPGWLIGKQKRHKGSLHSDIWRGSAADLASRGVLAVYPALGWWKTRPRFERYDRPARYALIISIRAPEVDIDLYTAIANQIDVEVET